MSLLAASHAPASSLRLPLFLLSSLLLILPSSASPRTRPVFGTERFTRSAPSPHHRLLLHPAPFVLRQPLPATRLAYPMPAAGFSRREDPLESYRAFVEQEEFPEVVEDEGDEEGEAESGPYASSSEAAYRHPMRAPLPPSYSLGDTSQYRFTPPYAAYYERAPEMAYGRPAAPAPGPRRMAADPVEDLEEEMRQEEEAAGWAWPWWGGGEAEEEDEEAEREAEEAEEEAAERAATDGAFLRNLILAQRYREDSLRPEEGKRRRGGARRGDTGDRAVKELESLAGKRSNPKRTAPERLPATAAPEVTPAPTGHPSDKGQKEVAVPRPASPPRRPLDTGLLVGRRWTESGEGSEGGGRSVYAALERLLEAEAKESQSGSLQRHHPTSSQRSLQKRFVSGEDVMMRQLNELKRA